LQPLRIIDPLLTQPQASLFAIQKSSKQVFMISEGAYCLALSGKIFLFAIMVAVFRADCSGAKKFYLLQVSLFSV